MSRPTKTPPLPSPIRGDDDFPLEHWRRVQRCAFPPGTTPEEERANVAFVAERIARSQRRTA